MRLFGAVVAFAVSMCASFAAEFLVSPDSIFTESIVPRLAPPTVPLRELSGRRFMVYEWSRLWIARGNESYATRLFCPMLLNGADDKKAPMGDDPTIMRRYRERVEKQLRSGEHQPIRSLEPSPIERAM